MSVGSPLLRFSDVAFSIGSTPKALRNYLQKYKVTTFTDYSGRNWTEFSLADVAILMLTRTFIRWGISVERSNDLACEAMRVCGVFDEGTVYLAVEDFLSRFEGKIAVVDGVGRTDGPQVKVYDHDDLHMFDAGSALVIRLEKTVREATLRAATITSMFDDGDGVPDRIKRETFALLKHIEKHGPLEIKGND